MPTQGCAHSEGMFVRKVHTKAAENPVERLTVPQCSEPPLEDHGQPERPEYSPERIERLEHSLRSLSDFARDRIVPTSLVVNPLLLVWDAAHELDPGVAAPVEGLLTVAVQRTTLEADELFHCIDEVRALILQHTVLADLVG